MGKKEQDDIANMPESSMKDKMDKAYCLAKSICYEEDMKTVRDTATLFGHEISDLLWQYGDGLISQFHRRRIEGRCSLDALISYDIGKEETIIEGHIKQFMALREFLRGGVHAKKWLDITTYSQGGKTK